MKKTFCLPHQMADLCLNGEFLCSKRKTQMATVKRDRKIDLTAIRDSVSSDLSFKINSFCLMKSELKNSGAEYSVLEEYKL